MAIKNKYSDIDLSKYSKGYKASAQVQQAQSLKQQAENAVKNYGDFKYGNQASYDKAMNDILNRKAFSYDINGDALYQQYKDMYMSQGKLAMADTIGQAAALTGGYGNSYAATVGNQAYQGYLQQLNGMIPELYNLALSTYNAESDRLNNNFNLLSADRNTQYGEYTDKYNKLINDRGYYGENYNNLYNQEYSRWADSRDYDQSQYWNEYNAGYQKDRDAVADAQWQKQFDESVRQYNASRSSSGSSGSRSSGSSKSSSSKTPTSAMYTKALDTYNQKGKTGLYQYLDTLPDYNTDLLIDHVFDYGSYAPTYQNHVANKDYANGASGRDDFDESVRNKYSARHGGGGSKY